MEEIGKEENRGDRVKVTVEEIGKSINHVRPSLSFVQD